MEHAGKYADTVPQLYLRVRIHDVVSQTDATTVLVGSISLYQATRDFKIA
jgi:hypothetical protein